VKFEFLLLLVGHF